MIPGLNDSHTHVINEKAGNYNVRWEGLPTLKRALEMLSEQAKRTPKGQWVDEHLRSADFFDVKRFKEIVFISNRCEKTDTGGDYVMLGDLTIKDITKPVRVNVGFNGMVQDPLGNEKAIFNLKGMSNRKEWGLTWNAMLEAGEMLVGDEISIHIEIQLAEEFETV